MGDYEKYGLRLYTELTANVDALCLLLNKSSGPSSATDDHLNWGSITSLCRQTIAFQDSLDNFEFPKTWPFQKTS